MARGVKGMWPTGLPWPRPMIASTSLRTPLSPMPRTRSRLAQEAEEDVLGADVRVVQPAGLLLREDDGGAGRGGEPFEHEASVAPLSMH